VAEDVIAAAKENKKPVLACWMGADQVEKARRLFSEKRVPCFSTPEASIEAFSYLSSYYRNQQLLVQVPGPLAKRGGADVEGARLLIEGCLAEGRKVLSTTESKALLTAFRIPTMPAIEARSANEALVAAESVGFPIAMKISSPDITHKSDVGGVRLNIGNAQAVRSVYTDMVESIHKSNPDADIRGVTVERMCRKPNGRELMVGVLRDPVFGPTISFGSGGTAVEVLQDRAVALPPLNKFIVKDLIKQTRVAKLLDAFRNLPPVNTESLETVLLRVSEMVCELPHIQELDINPLIADENGAVAVDARVVVAFHTASRDRYDHMAIHPYPGHLASSFQLADGRDIIIRPIRPEDAEIEDTFIRNLSSKSKYFRFMQSLQELTPEMLVRFTQIDYHREMALIATTEIDGSETEIAVGRYVTNPDGTSCEFALVVGDEWQRKGIGSRILNGLFEVAKSRGLRLIEGEVLSENTNMLSLVGKLGFSNQPCEDDAGIRVVNKIL
jgi:acetyltransferase